MSEKQKRTKSDEFAVSCNKKRTRSQKTHKKESINTIVRVRDLRKRGQ